MVHHSITSRIIGRSLNVETPRALDFSEKPCIMNLPTRQPWPGHGLESILAKAWHQMSLVKWRFFILVVSHYVSIRMSPSHRLWASQSKSIPYTVHRGRDEAAECASQLQRLSWKTAATEATWALPLVRNDSFLLPKKSPSAWKKRLPYIHKKPGNASTDFSFTWNTEIVIP